MKKKIAMLFATAAVCLLIGAGCADKSTKVSETPGSSQKESATAQTTAEDQRAKITDESVKAAEDAAKAAAAREAAANAEKAKGQKEEVVTPAKALDSSKPSPLETVYFDYDKSAITKDTMARLDKNFDYLQKNPAVKVVIVGHCDERGTAEYNMALGDRRATATKTYLTTRGLVASRLETLSKGKEEPADPGHDETAWAKNRRAQFLVK